MDTVKRKAPNKILKIDDPPNFQIQIANGELEKPFATATLKYDSGDNIFAEHFVVRKKLRGPTVGLHFMRNNSVVFDMTYVLLHFPHLTMQIKITSEMSAKPHAVLTDDALKIPPRTTKTITEYVYHPSEWNTTSTVTSLEMFTETVSLLMSHSMPTINDRKVAMRVTNTTETSYLIKRKTQIADISVVIPEQAIFNKPVVMVILSVIQEGDPDFTPSLNERLRTNKPQQQSNTFWFPTPENPGKIENHTLIQTRTLKELYELKEKKEMNQRDDTESRKK